MPRFSYKGYNSEGQALSDVVVAPDKQSARDELERSGVFITEFHAKLAYTASAKKISIQHFSSYNKELIALIRSGIPLVECLEMCLPRPKNDQFTGVLTKVVDAVRQGSPYSECARTYPEVFDSVYVATIKVSEQTGNILQSLLQYQKYLERKIKLVSEVKQALYYPIFLLSTLVVVMAILFVFVVPSFSGLYDSLDAELPRPTQIVLGIANYAPGVLLGLLITGILGLITWKRLSLPNALLIRLDSQFNKLPILGSVRLKFQQARALRMLEGLLCSGMPLVPALKVAADAQYKTQLGWSISQVARDVEGGVSVGEAIATREILPSQQQKMLEIGERSGALSEMVGDIADYLEEELDLSLKAITSLFEPIVMLALGVLTGAIIIAMYLPIFYLAEVVK